MLVSAIARTVEYCIRHAHAVIAVALGIALAAGVYAARHFAINTGFDQLIPPELPWRQRNIAYEKAFPGSFDSTLIVVDAPSEEQVGAASAALAQRLASRHDVFRSVQDPGGGAFFAQEALLYLPAEELQRISQGLGQAGELIRLLAADPSLRGLTRALSFGLMGVQAGGMKLDDMVRPLSMASDTLDTVLADRPASFSWQQLLSGRPPPANALRHFIVVRPVLDYAALQPGLKASNAVRAAANELDLAGKYQARVRLTGPIPIQDEEFASIQQGAILNIVATVVLVLTILWLALHSARIIAMAFINVFVGLAITAAVGLMMVGALNMISVAFAVLFIGIGTDFSIQFAVRYRAERHEIDDAAKALRRTAQQIGAPLSLAAAAVAAGFLSFMPTDYRGVAELGQIAGFGMLVSLATTVTLLPALLVIANPPAEPTEIGYRALAPVDRFMERHRIAVVVGTLAVVLIGAPLLYYLRFDFNPMHLRSPDSEAMATLRAVQSDPSVAANAINVVLPSVEPASRAAERLRALPEVASVRTVQNFVPGDQEKKIGIIRSLQGELGPVLQAQHATPATDQQNVIALTSAAQLLTQLADGQPSPGAKAAQRLAGDLQRLAKADEAARMRATKAFVGPLEIDLATLGGYLRAHPVALKDLPPDLSRQWVTPDGKARVEASPKGDPDDDKVLRRFADAVLAAYPNAVGGPVAILESGRTIISAFVQAGIYALVSIAILLWLVLRRLGDVALTLIPLLLAGLVTLELCVLIGMPLNFANIIALPLLLGIGVAFKIYYIMAWRAGQTNLLQSSLTRAVIWSALTTATAFGSLWLSNHPGTSSMGKLLALSLVCTLAAAVLFQPALMGRPRDAEDR